MTIFGIFVKIISIPDEELLSETAVGNRFILCLNYMMFPLVFVPRLSRKRGTLKLISPSVRQSVRPSVCLSQKFNLAHIF